MQMKTVILSLLLIACCGCAPQVKKTGRDVGRSPSLLTQTELKQFDVNEKEIPPFADNVFPGKIKFTGKLQEVHLCQSARLEVETSQVARPYAGSPTHVSDYLPRCESAPCETNLAPVFGFVYPPTGKAFKWQARLRARVWEIGEEQGVEPLCGQVKQDLVSDWVPFNNNNMAFRFREKWSEVIDLIDDLAVERGQKTTSSSNPKDMASLDNRFFLIRSTSGEKPLIRWVGTIIFENKQSVIDGFFRFFSKSSSECAQSLEAYHPASGQWRLLDERKVDIKGSGMQQIPLGKDLRGYLAPFGHEGTERGKMNIRLTCEGQADPFEHGFDLFSVTYQRIEGVGRDD